MRITKDNLIDLYSDYLTCCCGLATATGMSAVLDEHISHDKITRLLNSGEVNSKRLWLEAKPICEEISSSDGVLIIDDSVEEKPYTDCNEIIQYHFDHTVGRCVKGVNFISAIYHSSDMSMPVGVEFIKKDLEVLDKNGKKKRKSSKSKHEHFRSLVGAALKNVDFKYVLSDSWFACADNMKYIKEDCGSDFVMAMKENRKVALSWEDKKKGKYVSIKSIAPEGCVRTVYLEQLDFPISISKQVFTNGDGSSGTLYLAASDLNLTYQQVSTIYKKRWKVEVYHQSIKSNTAFPKSPTQTEVAQQSHFIASIIAFIKLETLRVRTQHNHFSLKKLILTHATKAAWYKWIDINNQRAA
ncbi:MAG: transposase [Bacteroidia bacterium]